MYKRDVFLKNFVLLRVNMQIYRLRFLLFSVCFFLLFVCACNHKDSEDKNTPLPGIVAQVITVRPVRLPEVRYFPGHVRSRNRVMLAAKIPGYVKEVYVQIGDVVKKGTPLVRMDDTDILSRIRAVMFEIKASRSRLHALSAKLEYDRINFNRFQKLHAEESATKDELDRARTTYVARKNQIRAIKAEISTLKARLREVRNQLSYVAIKSPVDGQIFYRRVDPGTYVNPGASLVGVDGTDKGYWFEAAIDDSLVNRLIPGNSVTVFIPALGVVKDVPVAHVQSSSMTATHTFTILADLGNMDVMPGLFGRVFVKVGEGNSITVPARIIISRSGIKGVYVVDSSRIIHWRIVRTGKVWKKYENGYMPFFSDIGQKTERDDLVVAVLSGLVPGDKVISSNLLSVREGIRLEQP